MNGNRIFIGNIKKCNYFKYDNGYAYRHFTNPETGKLEILPDEVLKEDALLIKVSKDCFIDIDEVKDNIEMLKIILKNRVLRIKPRYYGDSYIEEESLKPYYSKEKEKTNVYQLKKSRLVKS